MKTPENAVTAAVLLAAIVGIGDVPPPQERWEDGWTAALHERLGEAGGSAVLLAVLREPGTEYERGYRDGAAYLAGHDPIR